MGYLGMLALGAFVGSLVCIAIRKMTTWKDPVKVLTALLSAALAGSAFTFIQKVFGTEMNQGAIYMYPVGLLWSLTWLYADQAVDHVSSAEHSKKVIGWVHVAGIVLATSLVLLLLLSKSFRELFPT